MESKIEATHRLRNECRWSEACLYRDEVRTRLRAAGKPKIEAAEQAWIAMIEKYPPLPAKPDLRANIDPAIASEREAAIRTLPPSADVEDELSWVASHPKMRDPDAEVTADDILDAPAGRAPSQRACNMLLHYQQPKQAEKFWAAWLSQVVKKKPDQGDEDQGLKKEVSYAQLHAELMELGK